MHTVHLYACMILDMYCNVTTNVHQNVMSYEYIKLALYMSRVGQIRMYALYMTVYLFGDFPAKNTVYTQYIYNIWFWPTLYMSVRSGPSNTWYASMSVCHVISRVDRFPWYRTSYLIRCLYLLSRSLSLSHSLSLSLSVCVYTNIYIYIVFFTPLYN